MSGYGSGTGDQGGSSPESSLLRRSEGTNVIRVPFGIRQARRRRPERPDHWATLVLSLNTAGGGGPTPPQAA